MPVLSLFLRIAGYVSVVTTASATMFEPVIFVCHESGTCHLVTVIPVFHVADNGGAGIV